MGERRDSASNIRPLWKLKGTIYTARQLITDKIRIKRASLDEGDMYCEDDLFEAKLNLFKALKRSSLNLTRICGGYVRCIDSICSIEDELSVHYGSFRGPSWSCDSQAVSDQERENHSRTIDTVLTVFSSILTMSSSARVSVKVPLVRLHNEVTTFHRKALMDTEQSMSRLMKLRTEFRASLAWLKEISKNDLNPEIPETLSQYQSVQNIVKERKDKYDEVKKDITEKIDMLCASRCNMFSKIEKQCCNVFKAYCHGMVMFWRSMMKPLQRMQEVLDAPVEYRFCALEQLNGIPVEPYGSFAEERLLLEDNNSLLDLSDDLSKSCSDLIIDEEGKRETVELKDLHSVEKTLWLNEDKKDDNYEDANDVFGIFTSQTNLPNSCDFTSDLLLDSLDSDFQLNTMSNDKSSFEYDRSEDPIDRWFDLLTNDKKDPEKEI